MTGPILQVALPSPLRRLFDYRAPRGVAAADLQTGQRVRVPFGKRALVGLIGLGTLVMGALGLDWQSAFSATFSCVGNVGPAFGSMGPTEAYSHVPTLGKWVLSLLMMAGRLEIFTVLLLFTPGFWNR